MENHHTSFDLAHTIEHLKHYLPSQAPLKDFIHHNTLHAFQGDPFHLAMEKATTIFGYKVYLEINEYREAYKQGKISEAAFDIALKAIISPDQRSFFRTMLLNGPSNHSTEKRIGSVRKQWKKTYKVDMDSRVHPLLFRIISSYLDQGVATWHFPIHEDGFLASIRSLENNNYSSMFRSKRVKTLLKDESLSLEMALNVLLGDEQLYEHYLFDQQFAHPGWSGMVSVLEENPKALLNQKQISLYDLMLLECLFEIDVLDDVFGTKWEPISKYLTKTPKPLFSPVTSSVDFACYKIWQNAFEWSFYDEVLGAIQTSESIEQTSTLAHDFQALFCMDDRECSIRRHIEAIDANCETFGTPGHFNLEFFFQPEGGKFVTKVCPVPAQPKVLIKEVENKIKKKKDHHFSQSNNGVFGGLFLTTITGWLAPFKLAKNIVKPSVSPLTSSSSKHMDPSAKLLIQGDGTAFEDGLQVGFTVDQMTDRLEGLLRSIGLVDHFAPLVYAVGHGSTSVNNTHYAGYDCGACSGRPGSVNARVIAWIGNNPEVRKKLKERGINIPFTTHFVGALHDTSRDEMQFFDTDILNESALKLHEQKEQLFKKALANNASERSRRFMSIDSSKPTSNVHEAVKKRTVSLFEPRPELNHATNALAVVGRRSLTKSVFLDRRAFMNSYDYAIDPEGCFLETILNAVAPVAGGINLEYYFSRVDNQQLGAGSKLPHNVVGLFGVTNGIDGDLRTGLPYQMVEVHDPVRLLVIVEHFPEVVLETIKRNPGTYNWFRENWVHLVVVHPETADLYRFENEAMHAYQVPTKKVEQSSDWLDDVLSTHENIHPFIIQQ